MLDDTVGGGGVYPQCRAAPHERFCQRRTQLRSRAQRHEAIKAHPSKVNSRGTLGGDTPKLEAGLVEEQFVPDADGSGRRLDLCRVEHTFSHRGDWQEVRPLFVERKLPLP